MTGAIFNVGVPATIIKSDWRGLGRKTPAPKRSISNRDAPVAIISMAQQASPNVIGHSADLRAQLNTKSTVVVMMPLDDSITSSRCLTITTLLDFGFWILDFRLREMRSVRLVAFRQSKIQNPKSLGPLQCAFAPGVVITDDEDADEDEHLDQPEQRQLVVDDGPRKQEDRLHVED